jgi:PadR family transcriptional regulator PadR
LVSYLGNLREHGVAAQSVEFLKGTLDLMILKTLSWAPAHGYGIARWIEHCTDDVLQVEEGSLYPALYKLEENGLIVADWGVTEHNRRAKFYRLTAAGKRQLRTAYDNWARFARALTQVLEISPKPVS